MKPITVVWGLTFPLLAGLLTPIAAQAQHTIVYSVDASVNDAVVSDYIIDSGFGPLDLTAEEPGTGAARGWADVGIGVNRTLSQFTLFHDDSPVWHAVASGMSEWYDVITISAPVLDGTPGLFTTTMQVTGSGSFDVSDTWVQSPTVRFYGQWNARVQVATDVGGENETWQSGGWGGGWERNTENTGIAYFGDPLNSY